MNKLFIFCWLCWVGSIMGAGTPIQYNAMTTNAQIIAGNGVQFLQSTSTIPTLTITSSNSPSSIALSNITQSGASLGQSATWDGTAWVPGNPTATATNAIANTNGVGTNTTLFGVTTAAQINLGTNAGAPTNTTIGSGYITQTNQGTGYGSYSTSNAFYQYSNYVLVASIVNGNASFANLAVSETNLVITNAQGWSYMFDGDSITDWTNVASGDLYSGYTWPSDWPDYLLQLPGFYFNKFSMDYAVSGRTCYDRLTNVLAGRGPALPSNLSQSNRVLFFPCGNNEINYGSNAVQTINNLSNYYRWAVTNGYYLVVSTENSNTPWTGTQLGYWTTVQQWIRTNGIAQKTVDEAAWITNLATQTADGSAHPSQYWNGVIASNIATNFTFQGVSSASQLNRVIDASFIRGRTNITLLNDTLVNSNLNILGHASALQFYTYGGDSPGNPSADFNNASIQSLGIGAVSDGITGDLSVGLNAIVTGYTESFRFFTHGGDSPSTPSADFNNTSIQSLGVGTLSDGTNGDLNVLSNITALKIVTSGGTAAHPDNKSSYLYTGNIGIAESPDGVPGDINGTGQASFHNFTSNGGDSPSAPSADFNNASISSLGIGQQSDGVTGDIVAYKSVINSSYITNSGTGYGAFLTNWGWLQYSNSVLVAYESNGTIFVNTNFPILNGESTSLYPLIVEQGNLSKELAALEYSDGTYYHFNHIGSGAVGNGTNIPYVGVESDYNQTFKIVETVGTNTGIGTGYALLEGIGGSGQTTMPLYIESAGGTIDLIPASGVNGTTTNLGSFGSQSITSGSMTNTSIISASSLATDSNGKIIAGTGGGGSFSGVASNLTVLTNFYMGSTPIMTTISNSVFQGAYDLANDRLYPYGFPGDCMFTTNGNVTNGSLTIALPIGPNMPGMTTGSNYNVEACDITHQTNYFSTTGTAISPTLLTLTSSTGTQTKPSNAWIFVGTDVTPVVSNTLAYASNAGIANIVWPTGNHFIDGTYYAQPYGGGNCQVSFPCYTNTNNAPVVLNMWGSTRGYSGVIAGKHNGLETNGTIFYSARYPTTGNATVWGQYGALSGTASGTTFNLLSLGIDDMTFVTAPNGLHGLFRSDYIASVHDVHGGSLAFLTPQPADWILITPANANFVAFTTSTYNNQGDQHFRNIVIGNGFTYGLGVGDHLNVESLTLQYLHYGWFSPGGSSHDVQIHRLLEQQCTVGLNNSSGASLLFTVDYWDYEHQLSTHPAWMAFSSDISDSTSKAFGQVLHFSGISTAGNVNDVTNFTVIGGTNISYTPAYYTNQVGASNQPSYTTPGVVNAVSGLNGTQNNLTNSTVSGSFTNNAWLQSGANGFYTTLGTPWTNPNSQRGFFRIPFSWTTTSGNGWGVQAWITNYYGGPVGGTTTTTNVSSIGVGEGGLTALVQSGSNYISGFVGSNSVINVFATVGTITLLNVTNNQSTIDWQ